MAPNENANEKGDHTSQEGEAKESALVRVIAPSVALTVVSGSMLFSARQAVALKQFKDAADLTVFLSRLASAGALFEFLANPIFGKLSDSYGRFPVMPVGNFCTLWVRLLMFFQPHRRFPLVLEQAVSIPLVTSFFTVYRAALSDHLSGPAFTRANATISMAAGAAIVSGPLLAKAIMNRSDPKYCYLVSVFLAGASLLNIIFNFKESLPHEKRQPLVLNDMQPLGFLSLLRPRALQRLMLTTGLQTFTEGRNITDIISIYMLNDLRWSWNQINNFVSAYGMSLILSGLTVKSMLKALGMIRFTTFSNMCNVLNLLSIARVPPFGTFLSSDSCMWLALVFGAPGGRKRDAVESLILRLGGEQGYGNGFISGAMMNFRAVINVLGPLLFGSLYAYGARRKRSEVVFVAGALTILAAEASLRSVPKHEMGLDADGQMVGS